MKKNIVPTRNSTTVKNTKVRQNNKGALSNNDIRLIRMLITSSTSLGSVVLFPLCIIFYFCQFFLPFAAVLFLVLLNLNG